MKPLLFIRTTLAALATFAVLAPGDAAATCRPPALKRPAPVATTPCPGVRPGAVLIQERTPAPGNLPVSCTMGYMFRAGHERYISTAGHCAVISPGEQKVWEPGEGQVVFDANRRRIGEYAYADYGPELTTTDRDFSLIRLDKDVKASPEVCHFGGPTGINDKIVPVTVPVLLEYYGNTVVGGHSAVGGQPLLPARTGLATGLPDPGKAFFYGHSSFGDSGAPIQDEHGRAVGLISGPGDASSSGHAGLVNAVRLRPQMSRASTALGHKLKLMTAS